MKRLYEEVLGRHFSEDQQAAFVCGPRQVGKTTLAKNLLKQRERTAYFSWDNVRDRQVILGPENHFLEPLGLDKLAKEKPLIVFDEIHKYEGWKSYMKGFLDAQKGIIDTLVTGSAKLNVFRKGEDSLMGRYFLYRAHPVSVGELLPPIRISGDVIVHPRRLEEDSFQSLYTFGGFPEPLLRQSVSFSNRWQSRRRELMVYEDIRTFSQIGELSLLETLAYILAEQVGGQVQFTSLAKKIRVSDQTVRRWLSFLEMVYYCFTIRPWYQNVKRSLIKEPKIYLYDWSLIKDEGGRFENFIASHLLKAAHYWTDVGLGVFELFYLRTIDKQEVDFLITRDRKPWMMVECKCSSKGPLSKSLYDFHHQLKPDHTFQVVRDMPYVDRSCFEEKDPIIVPAKTFLSQLV